MAARLRYEPTQQQAAAPRKSSSARLWASAVLAVVGLLAVAFLFLSMVDVVEEQVARNQPQSTPGTPGVSLISTPAGR
jgi:type VI protein secretion system component VasF